MKTIILQWKKDSLFDTIEGDDHFWLDDENIEEHIEKTESGYAIVYGRSTEDVETLEYAIEYFEHFAENVAKNMNEWEEIEVIFKDFDGNIKE